MRRTTVRRRFVTLLSCSLVALMLLGSVCPARGRISARGPRNAEPPQANPNFTGFFDVGDCNVIAGWAADLNNLNTTIHVSVYDGPTLLTTVLANVSRPDVAAFIGDNGLHGFNIPTPSILKNGLPHSVEVRFESTNIQLSTSPRSITCPTPRDELGTQVILTVDLKLNNGAASTKSRLLGLNFTARELTGAASRDVTGEVTQYRVLEVPDAKRGILFPRTQSGDLSDQPWLPREKLLSQELALRDGLGKRYGERRILFQVKTATLTSDVASDTILLEPVLKEYTVSASGNTHPLIQYAASQGFQFPLDFYQTCKGECAGNFIADPALDSGSASVAVQALSQGGGQTNIVVCVLLFVPTMGLICNPRPLDAASGPAGTCTTKADYKLFFERSPNQFWRIKSAAVNGAYVRPHGANRFLAKFSFENKGSTCLPPSLISVGDVIVEGPEVDDFVDPANPWKNAFVRP